MGKATRHIPAVMAAHRRHKHAKGNSTPGKQKGGNCVASARDRSMARRSRSYREADYAAWCERKNGKKSGK